MTDAMGRGDVVARLREIWEDELGVSATDADEDFFDLGGDSLMALTVARRATEAGLPISPADLMLNSTLRALARVAVANEDTR
jgi:hypothetical protein